MSTQKNELFRQSSMDRISSPEQLQDYMRVTSPGIWMVLAAVIILLCGGFVCASAGKLETTVKVRATAENGLVTVSVPSAQEDSIESGMVLRASGETGEIEYVYENEAGTLTCTSSMQLPDGVYDAEIVTESISPIRFLIN